MSRMYERTHAHISFELKLDNMPPAFWMNLGEARSKTDHIKYVPLRPETSQDLHQVYFAKGVNATTAIEGNTLSEKEVRERIEKGLELPPSKEYLGTEIDNMVAAYNQIFRRSFDHDHLPLTAVTLRDLNRQILAGLPVEPGVVPGEFRTHSVAVGSYVGAPAEDCEFLIGRMCSWLDTLRPPTDDPALVVPYAFIAAVTAHLYLEWIHPFGDGNGRLGRLLEFLILTNAGIPTPACHVLTSHYNETRTEYYRQLNQATRERNVNSFLMYAAQGFIDGLLGQIKRLHQQQEKLMWRNWVDERYEGRANAAASRQRALAIQLGELDGEWVPRSAITTLTPFLAGCYADRTSKTVSRDLNELTKVGYIEVNRSRVRARIEAVRGMRPWTFPAEAPGTN